MALKLLLIKYRGVFAEHDIDVGNFSAVKHVIDVVYQPLTFTYSDT